MICALGQILGEEIRIKRLIGVNYPPDCLERFAKITNLTERRVVQKWLAEYRAQIINARELATRLSIPEQEEVMLLGLTNIAAFGLLDIAGLGGSYFCFSQVPGTLTDRHAYMLELLVPYLHQALTRVCYKSRDQSGHPKDASRTLTKRERQVLSLMATGMSNRAIATSLSRSELTVQNHVHAILKKIGVPNRATAVAWINSGNCDDSHFRIRCRHKARL